MNHDRYDDAYIREILTETKTIALVGASANPARPSYGVMGFLLQHGCRVIPVNPGLAGQMILGQVCVASLTAIVEPVDMVDVFRTSDALPQLVEEAIKISAKIIWTQLGVRHDEAAKTAEAAGIKIVMDRCPKIEIARLGL